MNIEGKFEPKMAEVLCVYREAAMPRVKIGPALPDREKIDVEMAGIAVNKRSGIAPECHPDIRSRYWKGNRDRSLMGAHGVCLTTPALDRCRGFVSGDQMGS